VAFSHADEDERITWAHWLDAPTHPYIDAKSPFGSRA
jgi:hypothetical protein